MSTTAHPIKDTKKAPGILKNSRANEKAKIRKHSGKVTAVVVVMTVFSKTYKNSTKLEENRVWHKFDGISTRLD